MRRPPSHVLQKTYDPNIGEATGIFLIILYHVPEKVGTCDALQRTFIQYPKDVTGTGAHLHRLHLEMVGICNAHLYLEASNVPYEAQRAEAVP